MTREYHEGYQQGYKDAKEEGKEPTTNNDSPKYCDRSICLRNEYNNVGCDDCEVTRSQEPTTKNNLAHNLCDSCTNIGCEFQSGIVRTECAFYMPPHIEPDNCGNYVVQDSTTKNDLAVDCISREQALNEFCIFNPYDSIGVDTVRSYLKALPSVTPQLSVSEVTALAEWTEKLTKASEDAYNKGYADGMKAQKPILDKIDEIITDALDKSTDQKESQTLRWVLDKISEVT